MATALANSVRLHHVAQLRVAGVDAVYRRGSDELTLKIVPGNHQPESDGIDIEEIVSEEWDWLITADALVLDGDETEPMRGDRIVTDYGEFEVMPRFEPKPYRYTDGTRQVFRVFTVEVQESE